MREPERHLFPPQTSGLDHKEYSSDPGRQGTSLEELWTVAGMPRPTLSVTAAGSGCWRGSRAVRNCSRGVDLD